MHLITFYSDTDTDDSVTSAGTISTVVGTGVGGYSGDGDQVTSAYINGPTGIDFDSNGNIYFSDYTNNRVRKITISTGIITRYAGTGTASYNGDGGLAITSYLNNPNGLCIDSSGSIQIIIVTNYCSAHLLLLVLL